MGMVDHTILRTKGNPTEIQSQEEGAKEKKDPKVVDSPTPIAIFPDPKENVEVFIFSP